MTRRILHVIRSVKAAGGGPIEGLRQLVSEHTAKGHHSEVLTLDPEWESPLGGLKVPCHSGGPAWGAYGYSPRFVPWLRANRTRFDDVLVHGLWQYGSFGVWRALAGTDTPYWIFPHGMLDPWFRRTYPLKHAKKWLYWPWGEYRVLRDAAGVLFTTPEECRQARQSFGLYHCREYVVGFGTTRPTPAPQIQLRAFLERFPQARGRRCLLFLGRIHEKKGVDLLLQAYAHLLGTRSEATRDLLLVLAGPGEGPYGRQMTELAEALGIGERLLWTGMLTGDEKWGAFRAAESFVLPSHQENFGVAVVEALACGVPVLVSDQINICREIAEDEAGYVDSDDLDGTVRLLEQWFSLGADERNRMGENALRCFCRRFDMTLCADKLLALFAGENRPKSDVM